MADTTLTLNPTSNPIAELIDTGSLASTTIETPPRSIKVEGDTYEKSVAIAVKVQQSFAGDAVTNVSAEPVVQSNGATAGFKTVVRLNRDVSPGTVEEVLNVVKGAAYLIRFEDGPKQK